MSRRLIIGIILSGLGALAAAILIWLMAWSPDVEDLKTHNPGETRLMTYRDSQYRKKGMRIQRCQHWIPLSRVSPALIQAVLISEDDKFYEHEGFDWGGIREAVEENWSQRRIVMGGSTITQQLAKNLYLKPTRNPLRKIQEAWIAGRLEKTLSKRRILELYLNVIEWGRGVYGIEAASRAYYDKPASDLTLAQAVRLTSVLPNPIRFSPLTDSSKRMMKKRRTLALRMFQKHLIDETECQSLLDELEGKPVPPPAEAPTTPPEPAVEPDSTSVQAVPDTIAPPEP
jgi:monofunctional biosynthetic peptidoglycan transglycosylase